MRTFLLSLFGLLFHNPHRLCISKIQYHRLFESYTQSLKIFENIKNLQKLEVAFWNILMKNMSNTPQ